MTNRLGSPFGVGENPLASADLNDTFSAASFGIMSTRFLSGVSTDANAGLFGFAKTSGNRVVAFDGLGSVWTSDTLGSTWYLTGSCIGSPTETYYPYNAFCVCDTSPNNVIMYGNDLSFITIGSSVRYSVNGGSTWANSKGVPITNLISINDASFPHSGALYLGGDCSGTLHGLAFSNDNGSSWAFRNDAGSCTSEVYAVSFGSPASFGVALDNGTDLFVTFDAGSNFSAVAGDPSQNGLLQVWGGSVWYLVYNANDYNNIYRGVGSVAVLDAKIPIPYQAECKTPLIRFPVGSVMGFGYHDQDASWNADGQLTWASTDGVANHWITFPTPYALGSLRSFGDQWKKNTCLNAIGSDWIMMPTFGNFGAKLRVGFTLNNL